MIYLGLYLGWAAIQYYLHVVLPGVSSICNNSMLEMLNVLWHAYEFNRNRYHNIKIYNFIQEIGIDCFTL